MIGVYPHGKGWRWAFCYSLGDVVVRVMGENGEPTDVPFVDVCHWPNPVACIADPLRGIGAMLADYNDAIDRAPGSGVVEKIQERRLPGLLFACEIHDTTLSKVQDIFNAVSNISRRYADGQRHEDRLYIWDLLCVAEVYGLDTLELRSLYEHLLAASKQPSAA